MNKSMHRLTQQLQPVLPLSTSFTACEGALRAAYPAEWQEIRAQVRAQETRCAVCGARGDLHVAHLDSQPDRLDRDNLAVLCADCHAAWDEPHVFAAAALTRLARWGEPVAWAAHCALGHAQAYGLGRVTPAMVDVVTADILSEGARHPDVLAQILERAFRLPDRAAATQVAAASQARLALRGLLRRQPWGTLALC